MEGAVFPKGQIQLLDLYGRVVLHEPLVEGRVEHTLNTASLPAGIYFMKILDGEVMSWMGKVIKE